MVFVMTDVMSDVMSVVTFVAMRVDMFARVR